MDRRAEKPPGFSLVHLLLWIACCGVYLGVVRQLAVARPGVIGMTLATLSALIDGTALAGLAIFITRRVRRVRWTIEPGEWLLAIFGSILLVNMMLRTVLAQVIEHPGAVGAAVTCVLMVVPMFSRTLPALWKGIFGIFCAWHSIAVVHMCLSIFINDQVQMLESAALFTQRFQNVVSAVLIGIAALRDEPTDPPRGWLHWVGIGTSLAMLCVPLILKQIL